MTETTIENPAETMRQVLMEILPHRPVKTPDKMDLTKAHLVDVTRDRTVLDLTTHHRDALEFLRPLRRKGTAQLADLDSLIAWANRNKGESSVLFANPNMDSPRLTCIADYHEAGPSVIDEELGDELARHCHHRGVYDFPLSDEWKAWIDISGQGWDKEDLGEFIEKYAHCIADPTPAILGGQTDDSHQNWENRLITTANQIEGRYGQLKQLLAMSRHFQVYETSSLSVTTNRDTGEGQIQFLNEHKDAEGQPLSIPNLIIIQVPIFRGGAPYRMTARFRYRKSGASVKFILSIYNPERAFEAAFDEAIATAQEQTDLPLFKGIPEL